MQRLWLGALFVLLIPACKGEEVKATVSCKVMESSTVECAVEQTQGTSAIEVCWGFHVRCDSGATLETERSCAVVKDGQTSNTTIPAEKITIDGKCEGEMTAKITNLEWKAK